MTDTTFTLNTGATIPAIGFGTWQIFPSILAERAVSSALKLGYRHVDTARIYGNEKGVGKACRQSDVAREELFVTTKLWNHSQGYDKALEAFDGSLARLGLDYVDLYLLHWPVEGKRVDSWRALEEIQASGRSKAIGVSNFTIKHLEELMTVSKVVPAVNQVEFHPFLYKEQAELLAFCHKHSIIVEAYSPLAHGKKTDESVLPGIADRHAKSTIQVILRWCFQHGTVPLPKSTDSDHMSSNLEIFDFELTAQEMQQINDLSDGTRTCWNPSNVA